MRWISELVVCCRENVRHMKKTGCLQISVEQLFISNSWLTEDAVCPASEVAPNYTQQ